MKNEVPGGEPITMSTVTIEEAQKKLSELIHRLTPGEEVVITENDQPVARLVATAPPQRKPRQLGTLRGDRPLHGPRLRRPA